jgi:hypothetical protein
VLDELDAVVQESTAAEMMKRAASPEIREAKGTGVSLSQGAGAARLDPLSLRAFRGR